MTRRRDALTIGAVAAASAILSRGTAAQGVVTKAIPSSGSSHPDADLLAACAAFAALQTAYLATDFNLQPGSSEEEAEDVERERITAQQGPLIDRMVKLRAATREGMAARARSLALWDAELMKDGTGDAGQCLVFAIVRDLVA